MFIRTFRGLMQLLGGLTVGLVVLLAFGAWRLSSGPISLEFMTPYLEQALKSEDGTFAIKLKSTRLAWDSESRSLEIRLLGAKAIGANGEVLAEVPELVATLAGEALLVGRIAPRSITIVGPSLTTVRRVDGGLTFDLPRDARPQSAFTSALLKQLISPEGGKGPLAYLDRIRVENGELIIDDLLMGSVWSSPNADIDIIRRDGSIFGRADLDFKFEDQSAAFSLTGEYTIQNQMLALDVGFADLNPRAFSTIFPKFDLAKTLDAPVTGTVSAEIEADGAVPSADFSLSAADGNLRLNGPVSLTLPFSTAALRGHYDQAQSTATIEELSVQFDEGTKVSVPAPVDHAFPLRRIDMTGRYFSTFDRLEISQLSLDLGGPNATLVGSVQDIAGNVAFDVNAIGSNFPVDEAEKFWPATWGSDPRTYILRNIKGGMVPRASVRVLGTWDRNDKLELAALSGEIQVRNTTVDYITGLPKVEKVSGTASFTKTYFDIQVTSGETGDLKVRRGRVLFNDLDKIDQPADIDLEIEGPLKAGLELINYPPLEFAKHLGIDPGKVEGSFDTELKLKFIAEKDTTIEDIKIGADATLEDVDIPDGAFGFDISDGKFTLKADNDGLDVKGAAKLDTVEAQIGWRLNFDPRAPVESRYQITGKLDDAQRVRLLGLKDAPFSPDFMTGSSGITATLDTLRNGKGRLNADFTLDDMTLTIPHFGWSKKPGTAGKAHVQAEMSGNTVSAISAFSVSGGGLTAHGSADFKAGQASKISLDRLAFGDTDISGVIIPRERGWDIDLRGPKLDFNPWLEEDVKPAADEERTQPITISLNVDKVQLEKGQFVNNVSGALLYDGLLWQKIDLRAGLQNGQALAVDMRPDNGKRRVKVTSDDAGEVLRAFGYYQNMVGGKLDLQGTYEDGEPGRPLKGVARITDFRVVKAPFLTRVLSLAALTGILEALTGEGLSFSTLEAPYVYNQGVISLTDAKASGISLGFTAAGTIDTNASTIDLAGTVVPAYAINSLLGRLPVVGQVFTGGEKGGGVFAASYKLRGPLKDPVPEYSPLSALAPGFLRNLFGILEEKGTNPAAPPAEASGGQQPSAPAAPGPPEKAPPPRPPVESKPLESN